MDAVPVMDAVADHMMNLDWLIIGGGIHGVHIAARLLAEANVTPDRLRIVDPGDRLLSRWRNCTEATGMTHLRSPSVHHLGLEHGALQRFAGKPKDRKGGLFAAPFERPSLALFNAHCEEVEKAFGLADLHIRNRAETCSVDCDGVKVQLADGREIETRNLVLAIGASEQPEWPEWAPQNHPRVHHVFDPGFDGWPASEETVMVVGGGISAGQVAIRLLAEGHHVHLVSRHALRQHQFDSDPEWLGLKYTTSFRPDRDPDERRAVITKARNKGSVSPDIGRSLRRAIKRKQLEWHEGMISRISERGDGLEVSLGTDAVVPADRVLLATGFASRRPGGAMVDELIESASLPCAGCGYPIVDSALRWHPRVYVSGPLAELELGPVSRNIAGARWAADRIVNSAPQNTTPEACEHSVVSTECGAEIPNS